MSRPKKTAPTAPQPETDEEQARRQAGQPPPRDIGPGECTVLAVEEAAALVQRHGAAGAIRALDIALREAKIPDSQAADIADATRLMQMRRRTE